MRPGLRPPGPAERKEEAKDGDTFEKEGTL